MIPFTDNIRAGRAPVITIAVILASVVGYALAGVHGGSLIGGPGGQTVVRYGAIPYEFSHWGSTARSRSGSSSRRCCAAASTA
jgi:hypothetical protein